MKLHKLHGFVLGGFPFGESHKIVTLLSQELGKIKVIAHGVRKTKSKYGSTFELFNEVELLVVSSKTDLYNIKDFALLSSFHDMRENLSVISKLYYLTEFLQQFSHEDSSDDLIYHLLKRTLETASENFSSFYALLRSFELKSLRILGFLSGLKECSQCGEKILNPNLQQNRQIYLSIRNGWFFCNQCHNPQMDQEISFGIYRFLLDFLHNDVEYISRLRINQQLKLEMDASFEKLMISILGKKLNLPNWLIM